MQPIHMNAKDAITMGQIYQHPVSHNLEWHDVVALIEHLGTVEEKRNGHVAFTINGLSRGFHRPEDKDISNVQEILDLRRFLEESGYGKRERPEAASAMRLLVVIDQKEARVSVIDEEAAYPGHFEPYDPQDNLRTLKHTEGTDRDAQSPENITYYKAIAEALARASEILLMGNGTGAASAMRHLQDYLSDHNPEVASKVVGALTVDVEALTDRELLEKACAFFAARNGSEAPAS